MADALATNDLDGAKERLPHLCGRDPAALDGAELARATIESVAENTSDAEVAPLFWGAVAGLPGPARLPRGQHARRDGRPPLAALRAQFGTAAARLDDAANLLPSRADGRADRRVAPARRRSPVGAAYAGCVTGTGIRAPTPASARSAMAGALGLRLGGRNIYHGRVEVRPTLGSGRVPAAGDIRRATRLSAAVGAAAVAWRLLGGARPARGVWRPSRPWSGARGHGVDRWALLVAGTDSDAGKSVVTAGICRWLHRRGVGSRRSRRRTCRTTRWSRVDGARDRPGPGVAGRRGGLEPSGD